MDQAQLLSLIGSIYDKLVQDVATHVQAHLSEEQLRAFVTPIIDASVTEAVAQAMEAHCEEYDHDSYDNVVNAVDDMGDLPDFDDFVTKSDLESQMSDAIQEAVGNLTFDITVR